MPSAVVQDGQAISLLRSNLTCTDGDSGYAEGQATVSDSSVSLRVDRVYLTDNFTASDHWTGTVTGPTTIEISESRFSCSGAYQGECHISPPLRISVTVQSPSAGTAYDGAAEPH
jgi:hypothetical protein